MPEIIIDYSALEDAKASAKKIVTGWNGIDNYQDSLNNKLKDAISEGRLSKSEPYNHPYIANAQQDITVKVNALNATKSQWIDLSSTIDNFMTFVKDREDKVVTIFKTTSSQYTDYKGKKGFFNYLYDNGYSFITVNLANSNGFTRKIADFSKSVYDDFSHVKTQVEDYFKHGNGRYVLNMVKSVGLTTVAVIGLIGSIIALPFTGGASCTTALACIALIGTAATAIGAGIQAFNTRKTIEENIKALKLSEDPGAARFYGDTESYSDFVEKNDLGSKEANDKAEKKGKFLDLSEAACNILAIGTGFINSVGTSTVNMVDDAGNAIARTRIDLSPSNIKTNVLGQLGIKTGTSTETFNFASESDSFIPNIADDIGDTNIANIADDIGDTNLVRTTDNVDDTRIGAMGSRQSTSRTDVSLDSTSTVREDGLTNRTARITRENTTTDYQALVESNNRGTRVHERYSTHAERSTTVIDFSEAASSVDTMDAIEASSNSKLQNTLNNIEDKTETAIEFIEDFQEGEEETMTDKLYDKIKDNYFFSQINDYVLSYDKDDGFTLFGEEGGEIWESWDVLTGGES